jgi:O-antigen ligase
VPGSSLLEGVVLLVLAWGAFSFGAVYPWAYTPLAAGCALCGLCGLLLPQSSVARIVSRPLVVALTAVGVTIVLQLAPLPVAMLSMLSPDTLALVRELDISFAAGLTNFQPVSIAPQSTLTALLLYGAFSLLLLGVARLLALCGPRRLASLLSALGLAMAIVGIVQRPLYAGKIYGFWKPMMPGSPFGPFVNKNHFAGWMLMALPVALGLVCAAIANGLAGVKPGLRHRLLWVSSPEASRVVLVGVAALIMAISLVLTMSRSGMLALAVAFAITAWVAIRRAQGGSQRVVAVMYFSALVVVLVGLVGVDAIASRFAQSRVDTLNDRLPIWTDTLTITRDFWLTGTGLNTYGFATLFYQTNLLTIHLREAHNEYLQLAGEGGLLVGIPVVVLIVVFVREVGSRFRESDGSSYWIRLGAVTGLVAIALQSVVDFSLQMPGNAALFAVVCAIALHRAPPCTQGCSNGRANPKRLPLSIPVSKRPHPYAP